jgi:hypothetical protein
MNFRLVKTRDRDSKTSSPSGLAQRLRVVTRKNNGIPFPSPGLLVCGKPGVNEWPESHCDCDGH